MLRQHTTREGTATHQTRHKETGGQGCQGTEGLVEGEPGQTATAGRLPGARLAVLEQGGRTGLTCMNSESTRW